MNYLAHLYLSDPDPLALVGNMAVDFLAGPHGYTEPRVLAGMERHRQIDLYTDQHPCFLASCRRIRESHRRYAPVIVDIYYDHFLALAWSDWAPCSLDDFSRWAFGVLEEHREILPPRLQRVLPHMIADNWVLQYAKVEGIRRALAGLSRRARRPIDLTEPLDDLEACREDFAADFATFFPEIVSHVRVDHQRLAGELESTVIGIGAPASPRPRP